MLLNKAGGLTNQTEGRCSSAHLSVGIIKFQKLQMIFVYERYLLIFVANIYLMLITPFVPDHYIKLIC